MDDLCKRAGECPGDSAARDAHSGRTISFVQLHERSARLSAYLLKADLHLDSTVVVLNVLGLPDLEVRWAVRRAGFECTELSTTWTPELQEFLTRTQAKMLFASSQDRPLIDALPHRVTGPIEIVYVDGSAAREIVDGYEWTVCMGEIPAHLRVNGPAPSGAAL